MAQRLCRAVIVYSEGTVRTRARAEIVITRRKRGLPIGGSTPCCAGAAARSEYAVAVCTRVCECSDIDIWLSFTEPRLEALLRNRPNDNY